MRFDDYRLAHVCAGAALVWMLSACSAEPAHPASPANVGPVQTVAPATATQPGSQALPGLGMPVASQPMTGTPVVSTTPDPAGGAAGAAAAPMAPVADPGTAGGAGAGDMMPASMDPPVVTPPMEDGPPSLYDEASGELRAPDDGQGIQISTSVFDLLPGQEVFNCYHTSIPVDGEINVAYFESAMAEGSHHFILYKMDTDSTPDGTLTNGACTLGFDQRWVYSSALPHYATYMPDGVAMSLDSRQKVVFDMHYINFTSETIHAQVHLNVNYAEGQFEKAASLISFNTQIRIPAFGKQSVGGDCTPGSGAKFFVMLTHTHRRGVLATITRVLADGSMGEELVRTEDWEHPTTRLWDEPDFLTFAPGEKFHYACDYVNDRDQVTTVGASADVNEMCMAITYYFPASATGRCN